MGNSINKHNNENNSIPLVSIVVITYNSEKYVLDTLNSCKNQTYQNIELIISDDASTDNTVKTCEQWLDINTRFFVRSNLICPKTNTGVSANGNRGIKEATGEWIKFIAGDDVLSNTCIEDCISYINIAHFDINVIIGAGITFIGELNFLNLKEIIYNNSFYTHELSSVQQYNLLLKSNRVFAPGSFIKRKFLLDLKGFNERYKNLEDYPFWLKMTKAGYKIYGFPKPIVYYRIRTDSIFGSHYINQKEKIVQDSYWIAVKFRKEIIYPDLSFLGKLAMRQLFIRNKLIQKLGNNRKKLVCKLIVLFFYVFSLSRLEKLIDK